MVNAELVDHSQKTFISVLAPVTHSAGPFDRLTGVQLAGPPAEVVVALAVAVAVAAGGRGVFVAVPVAVGGNRVEVAVGEKAGVSVAVLAGPMSALDDAGARPFPI